MKKLLFAFFFTILILSCRNNEKEISEILSIMDSENYKDALAKIERFSKKDFNYYYLKGVCLYKNDNRFNIRDSNKMFSEAYNLDKGNLENLYFFAKTNFELNELQLASECYQDILENLESDSTFSKENSVYEDLAEICFIQRKYQDSLTYISKLELNEYLIFLKNIAEKKIHNIEISKDDFSNIEYCSKDKLFIILDSLIPDEISLLTELSKDYFKSESSELSEVLLTYYIYCNLCNADYDKAKFCIEKIRSQKYTNVHFDKFVSFYYWTIENYESANWNADFYFFKYYKLDKKEIVRTNSKQAFEEKFKNDESFLSLRNRKA